MTAAAFDCAAVQRVTRSGVTLYAPAVSVLLDQNARGCWQYVGAYASGARCYASRSGARRAAVRLAATLDLRTAAEHCQTRRAETAARLANR